MITCWSKFRWMFPESNHYERGNKLTLICLGNEFDPEHVCRAIDYHDIETHLPVMGHCIMMTSPSGNIFRVTGPLCGEFTGHRWIPFTKASDAELWCFLWSAPEKTVEQTIVGLVIWDAIELIMTSRRYISPDLVSHFQWRHWVMKM